MTSEVHRRRTDTSVKRTAQPPVVTSRSADTNVTNGVLIQSTVSVLTFTRSFTVILYTVNALKIAVNLGCA